MAWVPACSVCGATTKPLKVDHHHVEADGDGPVRGLLCGDCNTAEGRGAGGPFDRYRADPPAARLALDLRYGSQVVWAAARGGQPPLHVALDETSSWWDDHGEVGLGGYSERPPWTWPDDARLAAAAVDRLAGAARDQTARGRTAAPRALALLRDLVTRPGWVIDRDDVSGIVGCSSSQVPSVWSALSIAAGTEQGAPPLHRKWTGSKPTRYALRPSTCQLLADPLARLGSSTSRPSSVRT